MKRVIPSLVIVIFTLLISFIVSAETVVLDPDNFADEANITNSFPGVTLSAFGGDAISSDVYSANACGGIMQGFGFRASYGIDSRWDQAGSSLRADFSTPTSFVEVDTIGESSFALSNTILGMGKLMQIGSGISLTAYDEFGDFVDEDNGYFGDTLSVSGYDDVLISYVVVSQSGSGGDCYGIVEIRYDYTGTSSETTICGQTFRIYGMAKIDMQQPGFGQPGRDEIRLPDFSLMPVLHDVDGNGYDTYLIIDIQTYEDEEWYGLFLGGCLPVYVPADKAEKLY